MGTSCGLNRTFYGIETLKILSYDTHRKSLNRTFYGIETTARTAEQPEQPGLNRTFYGIETLDEGLAIAEQEVLIVPFMELKL